MSRLLSLLNRLKTEAREELLTGSQLTALSSLEKMWVFPERVNLWGPPGSGKTFLGWVVVKRTSPAVYHSSPQAFRQNTAVAHNALHVIDNASSEPNSLRHLLAELQLRDIRISLIITRHVNGIGLSSVHLPSPTPQDIMTVYRHLNLLDQYALAPRQDGNLWQIIHSTL